MEPIFLYRVDHAHDKEKAKAILLVAERNLKKWSFSQQLNNGIAQKREARLAARETLANSAGRLKQSDDGADGFRRTRGHRLVDAALDLYSHESSRLLRRVKAAVPRAIGADASRGGRLATAPLRRLADRYVIEAALAVANGHAVPEHVTEAFTRLPEVMDAAETRSSQVERAVLDLVESVVLIGREGDVFPAVVTDTDDRGARIQLCDMAVTSRVVAHRVEPGDDLTVRLVATDPLKRQISFERVS